MLPLEAMPESAKLRCHKDCGEEDGPSKELVVEHLQMRDVAVELRKLREDRFATCRAGGADAMGRRGVVAAEAVWCLAGPHDSEEVRAANEYLMLKRTRKQHDEYHAQLVAAGAQLSKLSRDDVFQFHTHLEQRFNSSCRGMRVADAMARLIEGLCYVCGVRIASPPTRASLLSATHVLLKDPEYLIGTLCSMQPLSAEAAEDLAVHLLPIVDFSPMWGDQVNACYTALGEWLLAFYSVSTFSEETAAVEAQLEQQWQALLSRRMRTRTATRAPRPACLGAKDAECGDGAVAKKRVPKALPTRTQSEKILAGMLREMGRQVSLPQCALRRRAAPQVSGIAA